MKIMFRNKTVDTEAYLIMRNGEVWDVRLDASDYEVYDGKITDDMGSQYVSEIIPLDRNIDMGFVTIKEV